MPMSDERPAARRAVFLGVAVLASLGMLGLALFLGAWAFAYRHDSLHAGRLSRMLEERPAEARVRAGLAAEGMEEVASDASDETLLRVAGPRAAERAGEVRSKRGRYPAARLYARADLVYVVFYGADGKAADAALLKR
jgi:hypothetical protein